MKNSEEVKKINYTPPDMEIIQHPTLAAHLRLLYSDALHEYRVSYDWQDEPWKTWECSEWQCAAPLPSVTSVVGEYMQPFDADAIAA